MKEIIFLSFGNFSNYVLSHFFNLNDEILKNEENPFSLNHTVIYNESERPRALLFDYSNNIRRYYQTNEKLSNEAIESIAFEFKNQNLNDVEKNKFQIYQTFQNENNFLSLMTGINENDELNEEEDENIITTNKKNIKTKQNKQKKELTPEEIKKREKINELMDLSDEELYEYFDFENSIKNWNDFLRIKLPYNSLNEIKTIDYDIREQTSYIRGKDFLSKSYNNNSYYEEFEDNFRKQLEDCDRMEFLHFNMDYNSLWGGIGNYMLENIHEMIPKNIRIINGYDDTQNYNGNDNIFNIEKFVNNVWFLSDLLDIDGGNVIFNPIYIKDNQNCIKELFGYNYKENEDHIDPVYNFYYSSFCSLQLQLLYMPVRSNLYGKSTYIRNLLTNESVLNLMESDLFLLLEDVNNKLPKELITNGYLVNLSRNMYNKDFSWKKILEMGIYLNKYNSTICFGIENNYKILNQNYDVFLNKLSNVIFNSEEKFPLPICYPRKYYKILSEKNLYNYVESMSCLTNNRPYVDYAIKNLKNFKKDYKTYELSTLKYLAKIDKDKQFDYKDKCESIFNMIYVYQDLAENMLNIFDDEESDSGPDI